MRIKQLSLSLFVSALMFSCAEDSLTLGSANVDPLDISQDSQSEASRGNSSARISSFSKHHYVGNLDYVLADVKQAQITNKLTTTAQVDNLLDGFERLGVNGIRITIFPSGVNPNVPMFDYLYNEAVSRGFKIFANPAQDSGAERIANGTLSGKDVPPKYQGSKATNAVIDRVKEFALKYKCDWISPFNEDGAPGVSWYAGQFTNVYAGLAGQVNGAELIGSCAWGIPAGLETLQRTGMKRYITTATTHNLGFNNSVWPNFMAEAKKLGLPVWDSESTNWQKYPDRLSRIDAAIGAGVNGLVLYNSWTGVDLNTGELNSNYKQIKAKFTKYYYIQNVASGDRIKPFQNNVDGSLMVQAPTTYTGAFTQWEVVPTNGDWFRFRNVATGDYFRPQTDEDFADIICKPSFSGYGWHVSWTATDAGNGNVFLINRGSTKKLKSRNYEDLGTSTDPQVIKINQCPASWTGIWSQWSLIEAN